MMRDINRQTAHLRARHPRRRRRRVVRPGHPERDGAWSTTGLPLVTEAAAEGLSERQASIGARGRCRRAPRGRRGGRGIMDLVIHTEELTKYTAGIVASSA